jgi:homoserine kinase type II
MTLNLDEISAKLGQNFISMKSIRHGSDNNVFVLETADKKYILREALRDKPEIDSLFERNFSDFLHSRGIPVRKIIASSDNLSLLSFRDGASVKVENIDDPKAFNGGATLARYHVTSSEFDTLPMPSRTMTSELERAVSSAEKLSSTYTNGGIFANDVKSVMDNIALSAQPDCILHNDFRAQNVLFNGDDISAILDFDWACRGIALKDLGHALAEWSFPDGGKFNRAIFRAFLDGYKSVNPDIDVHAIMSWIGFGCLSDAATYLVDSLDDHIEHGPILSWMYSKYLFFRGQDITELAA